MCVCDPLEGDLEEDFEHLPCTAGFSLIGAYDKDNRKWIWFIAGMEDNESRPAGSTYDDDNACYGLYEAYAVCLSGSDIDVDKAPTGIAKNAELTALCQAIFDAGVVDGRGLVHTFNYSVLR
jgi:hypothetical protein